MMDNSTESRADLNIRYADALLPLTITFGIFTVVGFFGNILVLVVFALGKEYRNNNFKVFVICLGLIDFLTASFLIPAEMLKHRNFFSFDNLVLCKVKCLFNVWAGVASALALLIISVDRFRKVCQPLKRQITPTLAIKLCFILSFIVPIGLSWPGAVMCGIETANKTNVHGNITVVYLCLTEKKYKTSFLRLLYKYTFVFLLVGVSICCIVLYILIGRQIAKHWGSTPVGFRKDSSKECNSDYNSSDTFGQMKKSVGRSISSEGSDSNVLSAANGKPLLKQSPSIESSDSSKKRPKLVKQSSSVDMSPATAKKKLIKQISSSSFSFKKGNDNIRRRTMSRQNSGFGMRQFPYKTLIWFILTLVFVLTYILYLVLAIRVPGLVDMSPQSFVTFTSFYRLYFINNIINPIVYALLDQKFRAACKNLPANIKWRIRGCCN